MITKWEDIANDPYFLDLPPIGQQEIRTRWFNKVVAPDFRNAGMDEDNINVYRQRALETMLKSKDQAKAGYDAVLSSIQSSEDFTAPGPSPEQYKQSEEYQKANFIGKYADAPSNYAPWGDLSINPKLIFKNDAYAKAVAESNAPLSSKEWAMQSLPAIQQQAAPAVFEGFLRAGGIHDDFQQSLRKTIDSRGLKKVYRSTTDSMVRNWTPEQKAAAVQDFMASPDYSPNMNQTYLGLSQGADQLKEQAYGIGSFLGSTNAQKQGEEMVRQQQVQGNASSVAGGSGALNSLASMGVSVLPSAAIALLTDGASYALGAGGRLATTAAGAASAAARAANAGGYASNAATRITNILGAGAQTLGRGMVEAKQSGMSENDARLAALKMGTGIGALTSILPGGANMQRGLRGYGVEALKDTFTDKVSDQMVEDTVRRARASYNMDPSYYQSGPSTQVINGSQLAPWPQTTNSGQLAPWPRRS